MVYLFIYLWGEPQVHKNGAQNRCTKFLIEGAVHQLLPYLFRHLILFNLDN